MKQQEDKNDVTKMGWLHSLFVATKGSISSKRVCGVIGFLVVLLISIFCIIKGSESPDVVSTVLVVSASLLGIDSVTNVFKKQ